MANDGEGDARQFIGQSTNGLVIPAFLGPRDDPTLETGQGFSSQGGLPLSGVEDGAGAVNQQHPANRRHRAC